MKRDLESSGDLTGCLYPGLHPIEGNHSHWTVVRVIAYTLRLTLVSGVTVENTQPWPGCTLTGTFCLLGG